MSDEWEQHYEQEVSPRVDAIGERLARLQRLVDAWEAEAALNEERAVEAEATLERAYGELGRLYLKLEKQREELELWSGQGIDLRDGQ